jgi:stage V sporulation protein B
LTTEAAAETSAESTARVAGRGGVAVLGAKVFFLVAGFVQLPLLRKAIGLGDFGGLAQAMVVATVVNNTIITAGTQGVSRAVAAAPGREDEALRAALKVHVPLAFAVAAAMAAAAPVYVRFERAGDVLPPLLVLAGVALLYGLYAPLIGYLNGRNRFTRQAALDVTFATLRTVGMVGFGYAFVARGLPGVLGTTVGWVAAAACIVPLALRSTGAGRAGGGASVVSGRAYLAILASIAGAQFFTNLLMQTDLALLGRFLGGSGAGDATRNDIKAWVGVYKECQTFAFLPYQLLFSIMLVLFPMLARAHAEKDDAAVRAYVQRGSRLAALFCGLLVGVVVAMPESLLAFAYGADAARGADVLRIMALGQGAFAMLGIATTVLTSLGRERTAAAVTLGAFLAVALACAAIVPQADFGHAQLVRSAEATGGALLASLLVAGLLVQVRTGTFVPAVTVLRVGIAVLACFGAGFVMPRVGRLETPAVALLAGAGYIALLVLTREIGGQDLAMVRTLVGRRRRRGA